MLSAEEEEKMELKKQLRQLNVLKSKREKVFSQMQNIHDLSLKLTSENVAEFQPRFEKLTSLECEMDKNQEDIMEFNANLIDASHALDIYKVQNAFDDLLFSTRGRFICLMKTETPNTSLVDNTQRTNVRNNHLPTLSIPVFSGRIEDWTGFYSLFEAIVNNNNSLTDAEKFQYLRSYLRGDALAVISNFHMTADNYSLAYQALLQRYQNKRRLATFYVNQIREFAPLTNNSNLQNYLNVHANCVNALKALKLVDLGDFMLFHLSLCNLDPSSRKAFENKQAYNIIPTYENLINFVIDQTRISEMISEDCNKVNKNKHSSSRQTNSLLTKSKTSNFSNKSETVFHPCALCKGSHSLTTCNEFLRLAINEKYEALKKLRRCFNCLGAHSRYECQSKKTCRNCNSNKHHSLLHQDRNDSLPKLERLNSDTQVEIPSTSYTQTLACHMSDPITSTTVLLGTVQAFIKDSQGVYQPIRAVIDPGSQISAISSAFVQKLGLRISKSPLQVIGIGNTSTKTQGLVQCTLHSKNDYKSIIATEAVVLNSIANKLPSNNLPTTINEKFKNLTLADSNFWRSARVDFLIGANLYTHILCTTTPNIIQGNPSAINTIFGWVILGGIASESAMGGKTALLAVSDSLNEIVKQFWETEEVSSVKINDPEDEFCENHFMNTHYRQPSGRYVVAMPFRPSHSKLNYNRSIAFKSYLNMETRFIRRPEIASQYNVILKEYLRLGHMELAAQPSTYLLPHHCVCKPTSTTTKVRVVFNASAPDVTGISLNQRLLPGPKLQNDLANILLAFRFHAIAICADMKMMYRQILVDPDQRNVQHIFWRSSPEAAIQEFQLNTLTFGFSPAPYLAQRVIKQLVYDEGRNLSLASRALIEHTYVDDIVTGANTLFETQQLQSDLITLLGKGGFELRKWASNDPAALKSFPPDHLETPVIFSKNELGIKILGLMWDPKSDIFTYHVLPFEGPITKRSVLSYIARIFDPLGWLTPVVFWTKHFLQQLWMSKLDWDETFSNPLLKLWSEYTSEMHLLSTVKIPRHIPHSSYQQRLVGFCDASEKGYAASVYLHLTYADSVSNHFLLKAKSKVAPLKCLSIPRLELSAALLLAKLVSDILNFLSRLDFEDIRLFTDSTIVLAWINTPPHTLKTFVANRVVAILEMTSANQWGHIISEDNPADAGSRGLSPSQLVEHTLWWKGPAFLSSPISLWPCCYKFALPEDSISELKSNIVSLKVEIISSYLNEVINKFSSLSRLLRTFAFLLRFMDNIRSIPHTRMKHVSVDDLRQATMVCARVTQQNYYSELYNDLKNNSDIKNSLRMLSPFIDSDGLIRVGGRLRNSQLSKEAKYPILVPKTSHLAVLICDNYHLKSLHAGPRTVIALIQQKFWIVSLRSLIRQRIYRCLRCYKFKSKPQQPYMADLPSVRIQLVRAFHAVGMDFAGPFSVKESLRRKAHVSKGYLCIFVCMATKALHLEMVSELSTNAFLAALERFIARRGLPRHLYSDCGRNFVGAARHLKEVRQFLQEKDNDIFSNLASKEIKWHFNPPAAPNFGGIWESAVKSAKNILLRLIGDSSQTFEEFSTLFARIEAVLNSRPLCATSSDPNDGVDYLSPGHFLIGSSLLNAPEFGLEENLTFHCRWQRQRQLYQTFWKRWSTEYLHTQIQRYKWTKNSTNLHVGDVVYLYGIGSTPLAWPIGRVEAVHPGSDGKVRVATVRFQNGTLTRPVNKLVVLPTS